MFMKSRTLLFAAAIVAAPMTVALAASGTSNQQTLEHGKASNPHVEGATGTTIVPGNDSTIAGDRGDTKAEKKGYIPAGSKHG
jgi:hypothetical protein